MYDARKISLCIIFFLLFLHFSLNFLNCRNEFEFTIIIMYSMRNATEKCDLLTDKKKKTLKK